MKAVTLRSEKELEEVVKIREYPSMTEETIPHDVQVEEVIEKVGTKDLSKFKAKGVKKTNLVPRKCSPRLPMPQRLK